MNIVKGRQQRPVRGVIYGPEGIGKSTLAASWPVPLFVDLEGGTAQLPVDRVTPLSWGAVAQVVADLSKDPHGYKTVIFDTADWLEKQLQANLVAEHQWRSIETPSYGKGYAMMAEDFRKFLDSVGAMQESTGMHVVFCAHAWLRKQELPDEAGAFDRWEMKLSKHVAPALKEWADLILFCNYNTIVVAQDNGKAKAHGQERAMYATHHACWDAKNRFGLSDRLPMTFASLSSVFAVPAETAPVPPATEAPAQAQAPETPTLPPERVAKLKQLRQLMDGAGVALSELQGELARNGVVPQDMSPRDYNDATLDRIIGKWAAVENNIKVARGKAA